MLSATVLFCTVHQVVQGVCDLLLAVVSVVTAGHMAGAVMHCVCSCCSYTGVERTCSMGGMHLKCTNSYRCHGGTLL